MRILLAVLLVLALLVPASAGAAGYTVIPPSNSAADQYRESIPAAGGNRSATAVVTGESKLSPRLGTGSPISAATRAALIRQGRDGRKVARLTRVTAPSVARHRQPPAGAVGGAGRSPSRAVVGALSGLDGSGGLGAGLPVILALSALVAIVVGVRRRRAG